MCTYTHTHTCAYHISHTSVYTAGYTAGYTVTQPERQLEHPHYSEQCDTSLKEYFRCWPLSARAYCSGFRYRRDGQVAASIDNN